jgi:hypothetical protein
MHAENPQLEFRVSEVSSPSRGDEIHIDGYIYRIESEPRLDLHHLVWVAPALPCARDISESFNVVAQSLRVFG